MKFLLFLLSINSLPTTLPRRKPRECDTSIVESYNMESFIKPRRENLWICPRIT